MLSFLLKPFLPVIVGVCIGFYGAYRWDEGTIANLKLAEAQFVAREARDALASQRAQYAVTLTSALKTAAAQEKIRTVTRIIVEKVPTHVTPKADAACAVSNGFVRLFDAAASGTDPDALPGAAGESDDAASGVTLSQIAALSAEHDGQYHAVAEQLNALQNWVRAMSRSSTSRDGG
jgi:hypothetical protein